MRKLASTVMFVVSLGIFHSISQGQQTDPYIGSVSEYNLSLSIQPEKHILEVNGTWRLPSIAKDIDQVDFYLSPKMQNLTVQVLEPKSVNASLSRNGENAYGDPKWTIKTTRPIVAGQSVVLQFAYISETKPAPQFNISPAGSFAGGLGESWYPQISDSNRETGTLSFKVPAGETVLSNGALQSNLDHQEKGEFVFRVETPSKFGFASGKYTLFRRAGKNPVNLYLLRPRDNAQLILDGSAKALDLLSSLFGDFPYQQFSLVEIDFRSAVTGTSEFGFILADDSQIDKGFDLAYWAHEIGHQWWGNSLRTASDTTGRMMLSEGMAQFGALLAIEAIDGEKAAETFRRSGLYIKNQSAESFFQLATAGTELPLTTYSPKGQDEILRMHRLANSKGFIALDMLSRQIGREKFASILKQFVRQHANRTTSWQDFQKAVEAGAGHDVNWFFKQWFERIGAPDYQITWKQMGKKIHGSVTQPSPVYRATLEVELKGRKRSVVKTIEVNAERQSFDWSVAFQVDNVILDPNYKVLRWTPEFRVPANVTNGAK